MQNQSSFMKKNVLTFCLLTLILTGMTIASQVRSAGILPQEIADTSNPLRSRREKVEAMHLLTDKVGWVLTPQRLLRTSSAGRQWDDITPLAKTTRAVRSAFFLDTSRGWAVISVPESGGDHTISLKLAVTDDGGQTWSIKSLAGTSDDDIGPDGGPIYIDFVDDLHGWVMIRRASSSNFSRGVLLTTADGGNTWNKLPDPPIGDPINFISLTDGWVAGGPGGDELYVTHDGGHGWKRRSILPTSAANQAGRPAYDLPTFQSSQDGVLPVTFIGDKGSSVGLYRTSDGGRSWRAFKVLAVSAEVNPDNKIATSVVSPDVQIVSPSFKAGIMVIGEGGKQRNTVPADNSLSNASIIKTEFKSSTQGWVLAAVGQCAGFKTQCGQETRLLSTTDGGRTWAEITPFMASANSVRSSAGGPSGPANSEQAVEAAVASSTRISQNKGFDKCAAATVSNMRTWWNSSPYYDVNIYIGGISRSCAQANLNSTWVSQVSAMGWGLIPTWVGPQASCTSYRNRISANTATARSQGLSEADKAADTAASLGLSEGTIIYYDLEHYNTNATCSASVKAFVNGWVERMHARGNKAGVYGSPANASADWAGIANPPDAVWIAKWDGRVTVWGLTPLSDSLWYNHQRIHQYRGGHNETWGGVTFSIDNNISDGPVAVAGGTSTGSSSNRLQNPGFESGRVSWTQYSSAGYNVITNGSTYPARTGSWYTWYGGANNLSEYIYQDVVIPANATQAYVRFWYRILTNETSSTCYDRLSVQVRRPGDNALLATLTQLCNSNATGGWVQSPSLNVFGFRGQTIRLRFYATNDSSLTTSFFVDDVALVANGN